MHNLIKFPLIFLLLSFLVGIHCGDFEVRDFADLRSALDQVQPGDVINLVRESELPKLVFRGLFEITRNGTASAPIHLNGHPNISFTHVDDFPRVAIQLKADHWVLKGLKIFGETSKSQDEFPSRIQVFGGLEIRGNYNKILDCEVKNSEEIAITRGNFNEIKNCEITGCQTGISLHQSSDNLVENCHINQSRRTSISIAYGSRNTFRNNTVFIKNEGSRHLWIGSPPSGGNNITRNSFLIEEVYIGNSPIFVIYYDPNGVFEGNRVVDLRPELGSLFHIMTPNYTVSNNSISTWVSSPIFKIEKEFFGIKFESIGIKFGGNRMEFLDVENLNFWDPDPFCIFGDPEFHSNNTEIGDDNICTNGKLTNIFKA